ncbi:MAG TPA: phytanoyl-CoA dioxygenase family protein [Acidimicrobiales bacterium]|nr:phytanoyl-CoA dioxygenase family protein [Acidimicrobiales bacterium]
MSSMAACLEELGVKGSLLSDEQYNFLDTYGYVILPGALDGPSISALRARFDELVASEGELAGSEVSQEEGSDRLANLVDKDPRFDSCWTYPPQLAAVSHVFGGHDFKLHSVNGRSAHPGSGLQGLHTDWPEAVAPGDYQVCNSIWMLDAFTEENGATRVVPGSHRWGQVPREAMTDPRDGHPEEVLLLGDAGTCGIFNSHVWHGGTANRSSGPRRALHGAFVRREHTQQTVQRDYLRPSTVSRLTAAQRFLLDV